jgi:hypothetical protein
MPLLKRMDLLEGQPLIRRMGGMKNLSPGETSYLGEILRRHEVDEARAAQSPKSLARRTGRAWTPGYIPMKGTGGRVQMGTGMHMDPSVLMEESRHATLAPKKVRRGLQRLRGVSLESPAMAAEGVGYGEATPLRGSRQAAKAERAIRAASVPPNLPLPGAPMQVDPALLERGRRVAQRVKGGRRRIADLLRMVRRR